MPRFLDGPTNTREDTIPMQTAKQTGLYRAADGTHHRIKAKSLVPDGYVLIEPIGDLNHRDEVLEAEEPAAKAVSAAPENKAETPPSNKAGRKGA